MRVRATAMTGTFPGLDVRHLSPEELARSRSDVVLLDGQHLDLEALCALRRDLDCPVLVMCRAAQEDEILRALRPSDDVIRPDASDFATCARAERVALAGVVHLDELTRVLGKVPFVERLARALESATVERPVSLVVLDLDHFKGLNDEQGHLAGDEVLQKVALCLRDAVTFNARIGRVGGEEFAVFFTGDREAALFVAERLRQAVEDARIGVTISSGVTTTKQQVSVETLMREANEALYAAKVAGRNRAIHHEDFEKDVMKKGESPELVDFENLTRVVAERVADAITHRGRRVFESLRKEADRDSLTGLFSRRYLDRRLPFEVEHASDESRGLTIALIDLDNFGQVNKKHGWPTGDRVLRAIAETIQSELRGADWAARYGGEEILVVLSGDPEVPLERVRAAAEALRHPSRGGAFSVTLSVGAARTERGETSASVVERASNALLEAKGSGKNCVNIARSTDSPSPASDTVDSE